MGTIADKLTYLIDTKNSIIEALEAMGVTVPSDATFRDLDSLIRSISTSDDINFQVGTVDPNGSSITLTPDNGYDGFSMVLVSGDANLTSENIRKGVTIYGVTGVYQSEGGDSSEVITPTINLKQITITPTGDTINLSPEEGYDGYSMITVVGDSNLIPANIVSGKTIYGITGTATTGSDLVLKTLFLTPTGKTITITAKDRDCDGFKSVIIYGDSNLVAENIVSGKTIYGVTGTAETGSGSSDGSGFFVSEFDSGNYRFDIEDMSSSYEILRNVKESTDDIE